MEGVKTNKYVDCRRNIFGNDVDYIRLSEHYIKFGGPTFELPRVQSDVCTDIDIPAKVILGGEFIKKKKNTKNWFEKIFTGKEEWIRIYY